MVKDQNIQNPHLHKIKPVHTQSNWDNLQFHYAAVSERHFKAYNSPCLMLKALWNTTTPWNHSQIVLGPHCAPHVVWQDLSSGFPLFFIFEKLRGFKPSQIGPFCAKCMCSSSLLPQRSLRCESQRLEVSGPGGARCLRRPVEEGCKREEGWEPFPVLSCYLQQKPRDFLHKVENVLENVINIRVFSLCCLH